MAIRRTKTRRKPSSGRSGARATTAAPAPTYAYDGSVLPFVKMHGLGNDYVYVDLFATPELPADPADLARRLANRHFGIGSDGLILVGPSDKADLKMTMFNADGSEGAMCGNGIRCVAKLGYESGYVRSERVAIETASGVKTVELITGDGRVEAVRVNMGVPNLAPNTIPVNLPGERVVGVPFMVKDRRFDVTCVSMGNPHAVVFCEDAMELDLKKYGPAMENHPMFPDRVNAHFVRVHSRGEVTMRTWERGSGATLACGTGASAVCVAGALNKLTDRQIIAHLPGGNLELNWDAAANNVFMTGPATEVYRGQWIIS
ncbi:MAG: Diaminopimelate epimerase [Phycisphaerae bacterium]|nr:Diaminopimelate epimerase [Phycisphaerae bacterium]